MIFSQRYKELIIVGNGMSVDNICGEISSDVKVKIGDVLQEFNEPTLIYHGRYNSYEEQTDAFTVAINLLHEHIGYEVISFKYNVFKAVPYQNPFLSIFTPWLFDLIELQFGELSDGESLDLQIEINAIFQNNDIPWLLIGGRMVKIDAQQFELDLQRKALEALRELQNIDPKFQSAYAELLQACTFLESGNYGEAIANAGNSYESVLKIICTEQKGNADKLTKQYTDIILTNLPVSMTNAGFREKVMMALPFIRNNSSSAHGAGAEVAVISKPLAKLAINLSAAMNTYLIEEYIEAKVVAGEKHMERDVDKIPF